MDYFLAHWWIVSKDECKDYRLLYKDKNDTELINQTFIIRETKNFWSPDTWMINSKETKLTTELTANEIMMIKFANESCMMTSVGRKVEYFNIINLVAYD